MDDTRCAGNWQYSTASVLLTVLVTFGTLGWHILVEQHASALRYAVYDCTTGALLFDSGWGLRSDWMGPVVDRPLVRALVSLSGMRAHVSND